MSTATRSGDGRGQATRALIRQAWNATLATIEAEGGHPYGSLVAIAAEPDGSPLLLLSGLAVHTKNIQSDPRVSLMIDGTGGGRAALRGARVTLVGLLSPTQSGTARRRYLARHPDAVRYIDFGDFGLYTLDVSWAHLVAGFGRIERLRREDVILPTDGAESMIDAETSIIEHMNDDHAEALTALAAAFGDGDLPSSSENGGHPPVWTMVGCDPEGIDLVCGERAARLLFPQRVSTPDEVRSALIGMVAAARQRLD